jgi:protein tyrosine phosphatase (PTP) superfamily phosphohydrolase (DUF442 family)
LGARRIPATTTDADVNIPPHQFRAKLKIVVAAMFLAAAGCSTHGPDSRGESRINPPPLAKAATTPTMVEVPRAGPQRLAGDLAGLHNVIEAGDGLLSGSEPEGEEGFVSLAKLGVKTIVSVDGARPDVEAARRHGLRYVHIPIGYDGLTERASAAIARAAREADRPVYVHCHHGKHRGPAAAAIACIVSGKADGQDALRILELAGTGKEYPGLWRDVEHYQAPSPDAPLPELVEVADVGTLAAAMAGVDRQWDNLKLCRDSKWESPRDHPDLSPLQEAVLLREALHEAGRTTPADRFDERFRTWLSEAESLAAEIEANLKNSNHREAGRGFELLDQACKRCHAAYRN